LSLPAACAPIAGGKTTAPRDRPARTAATLAVEKKEFVINGISRPCLQVYWDALEGSNGSNRMCPLQEKLTSNQHSRRKRTPLRSAFAGRCTLSLQALPLKFNKMITHTRVPTVGSSVTATISGATIKIQSIINEVATNYLLSVGFGFGPNCASTGGAMPCFNSPSYMAIASGAQLTGGTN